MNILIFYRIILIILLGFIAIQCNTNDPINDPLGNKERKRKRDCKKDVLAYYLVYSSDTDYKNSCNNPDYELRKNSKSFEECLAKKKDAILFSTAAIFSVCSSDDGGKTNG